MHGPRVPGDGDALRPVVREQLEEHVREPEQRAGREALARRELLGEREVGAVGEVVAVDEEELGVARRARRRAASSSPVSVFGTCLRVYGPLDIVAFTDEHVDGAAAVLAERHAAHLAVERLLPRPTDFREQVEKAREDATGAAAIEDGEVVGYLLGPRREDGIGEHVWIASAGHAVRDPEVIRDLYAVAAERWVEDGLTRHFVYVPAMRELVEPWLRLSFGISAAQAAMETRPAASAAAGTSESPSA